MTAALFWDIDGTLLNTARSGIRAWEGALEAIAGPRVSLEDFPTAGMTDGAIARVLSEQHGDASEAQSAAMLAMYVELLPAALRAKLGGVLPGVRSVLEELHPDPGVRNLLLTGNVEAGAREKLTLYGLMSFFPDGGAFCAGDGSRTTVARNARALAPEAEVAYVIGDTPADIACGKAIGAHTVAVASGRFDADALAKHDPWLLLERIPEPATFRAALGV